MIEIAEQAIRAGAIQKRDELAALLDAMAQIEPAVIVEVGSDAGGTLLAWRTAFPSADVLAISLQSASFSTGTLLRSHGATVIEGDSHDPNTLDALQAALGGRAIDALFIDADHTYDGVRRDFLMYAPLVRPGGLVAFHDICHHATMPEVGVERLWGEVSGTKREFVVEPENWGGIGVLEV